MGGLLTLKKLEAPPSIQLGGLWNAASSPTLEWGPTRSRQRFCTFRDTGTMLLEKNFTVDVILQKYHIAVAHGLFNRIHQVVSMCTPCSIGPRAHTTQPKRHLDRFTQFKAHCPRTCAGMSFPQKLPLRLPQSRHSSSRYDEVTSHICGRNTITILLCLRW